MSSKIYVIKRNGSKEEAMANKIHTRLYKLKKDMDKFLQRTTDVSVFKITQYTISKVQDGQHTSELDYIAANYASMDHSFPDNNHFAGVILVGNLMKVTPRTFQDYLTIARNHINMDTGKLSPLLTEELVDFATAHIKEIETAIHHDRNYLFDFFGISQLINAKYLIHTYKSTLMNGQRIMETIPLESPQFMFMRVALALNIGNINRTLELYELLSTHKVIMATPTLFNAGTPMGQMSSCFLLDGGCDSLDDITDNWCKVAQISKRAGGIGLNLHGIRSSGSYIAGTNGYSQGIAKLLQVYNSIGRYVDQCFQGKTRVMTPSGWKYLNSIQVGDTVMNGLGEADVVKKVISAKKEQVFYRVQYENGVVSPAVTSSHPLLCIEAFQHDKVTPHYVPLKDINPKRHWLATLECPAVHDSFIKTLDYSDDFLLVMGVLCADYTLDISEGLVTTTINPTIQSWFTQKTGAKRLDDTNEFLFPEAMLFGAFHGRPDDLPHGIIHAPLSQLQKFMDGMEMQGSILNSVSCQRMHSLEFCAHRLGFFFHVQRIDDDCFQMTWPQKDMDGRRLCCRFIQVGNWFFRPIQTIFQDPLQETTCYDLEMTHHPSYVTPNFVAHNGGGKRQGSFAIYLEPWHPDILTFLEMKLPTGADSNRARSLFYAVWMNDLLMKRIITEYARDAPRDDKEAETREMWSLFNPVKCPGLNETYGDEFEQLYLKYEQEKKYECQIQVRKLVEAITSCQIKTGTPYILFKDHCNRKSNQKNLGTIKSSNLCAEIIEFSSRNEVAVCNLASVSLPAYINPTTNTVDYQLLHDVVYKMIYHMNQVIDRNNYPLPEAKLSNMRHRPLGLGIQGLANLFFALKLDFDSVEAQSINYKIAETMYYAALKSSHDLAQIHGNYPSMLENGGAPITRGILQQDLWDEYASPDALIIQQGYREQKLSYIQSSVGWDWDGLRESIKSKPLKMYNSLLIAHMPGAGTSQILGNYESFEPPMSAVFKRLVNRGEFILFNRYLINDLKEAGLWEFDENGRISLREQILSHGGDISAITSIPEDIRRRYRGIVDVDRGIITLMAADRGRFIDQSMSLNVYMKNQDNLTPKIINYWMFAWRLGLKTCSYYLRSIQKNQNINFALLGDTTCLSCT